MKLITHWPDPEAHAFAHTCQSGNVLYGHAVRTPAGAFEITLRSSKPVDLLDAFEVKIWKEYVVEMTREILNAPKYANSKAPKKTKP